MGILTELGSNSKTVKLWLRLAAARQGCRLRCGPYAWDLTKDTRVIRLGRPQFDHVADLAERFDSLFETLVPQQAGRLSLLDFSHVHAHVYRTLGVPFELAAWPEADATIQSCFEYYDPKPTDLIFDVGAQCGVSTYVFSKVVASVVALETDARLRGVLKRNVERHRLSNVLVPKNGVASLTEMIAIFGDPVFCRLNLDHITPEFWEAYANAWAAAPIQFAAHGSSENVVKRFDNFLNSTNFETCSDLSRGLVWGRHV
jgi:hypothetical protein